ncbi:bactofilin family protein [Roseospira goensis]|uniref:Cytoskeletal protein CcmA (Bactofilin family) n=1 Tax=Roseospira goensis TaxID=391922 RepID=A0A7W6S2T1_9PROT|nr:polymer-forming cytoskeletal protein [Roseospira goensis]MBB4287707.1 cytoskeletal protein CcmA (bactofilin family) [Roseospira goensis]
MAFFGNSPQGRPSGGGHGGPTDGERAEAGDGKGGFQAQPHEPSQVSSPKFQPGMPVKPQTGAFRPEPPVQARADTAKAAPAEGEAPATTLTPPLPAGRGEGGDAKNLIVGRGIQLNGQISACDRLVVEGTVEADLNDAEAIEVTASGLFKGTASIEEADISGRFEGNLIVKRRLVVRDGGRIEGNVQYAAIVIEEGGQVRGQMDVYGEGGGPA